MTEAIKAARETISKANIAALKKSVIIEETRLAANEKAAEDQQALLDSLEINPLEMDPTYATIDAARQEASRQAQASRDAVMRANNRVAILSGEGPMSAMPMAMPQA